jgi:hypothetical protein
MHVFVRFHNLGFPLGLPWLIPGTSGEVEVEEGEEMLWVDQLSSVHLEIFPSGREETVQWFKINKENKNSLSTRGGEIIFYKI